MARLVTRFVLVRSGARDLRTVIGGAGACRSLGEEQIFRRISEIIMKLPVLKFLEHGVASYILR